MRYYFHVNFKDDFPYGGFVDVDEKTPIYNSQRHSGQREYNWVYGIGRTI